MDFLVTDSEAIGIFQAATRALDGRLILSLPDSGLQSEAEKKPYLTFLTESRAVQRGKVSCRLSPIQFALLRYVYTHGRVGFEELQDRVWGETTTDGAIRAACQKINARLLDAGFAIELVSHHSRVSVEKLG